MEITEKLMKTYKENSPDDDDDDLNVSCSRN